MGFDLKRRLRQVKHAMLSKTFANSKKRTIQLDSSSKIRLNLLAFLAALLSLIFIVYWEWDQLPINDGTSNIRCDQLPEIGDDRRQHFWGGLEQFAVAAEREMTNKPIPDIKLWRSQRILTINRLKELRTKLDNVCFYGSCGKAVGSSMGILCTLSSLATAITGFLGGPFSLPVASFGGILCPTGYFTRKASSIMESILSAKYQNELQAVLLRDKEVSKSLDEWLQFSSHLETEFQNIFGFELKSEKSMKFILLTKFHKLLTRFKNFEGALKYMKRGKYASLLEENFVTNELQEFGERAERSLSFSNKIKLSLHIFNNLISANYTRSLMDVYQNVREKNLLSAILFFQDKLDIKIPFPVRLSAFIFFNVLDITKEVTYLIDEAKIIKDGKCPYSGSLKHITDMLEQELNIIESSNSYMIQYNAETYRLLKN